MHRCINDRNFIIHKFQRNRGDVKSHGSISDGRYVNNIESWWSVMHRESRSSAPTQGMLIVAHDFLSRQNLSKKFLFAIQLLI